MFSNILFIINIQKENAMATINKWRVLKINGKLFLTAIYVTGHQHITSGPILTSEVVAGDLIQGGSVQTKSGTIYKLEEPLPQDEDCEFAKGLLVERVSRNFNKQGKVLPLAELETLLQIIDRILAGK